MGYAVYLRVSSDKDEQISSIGNQEDICRYWLERNGYEWNEANTFKDDGITGTILLDRPAIQLILEKARKKEIDMVIFKSIHRLARDLKDALEMREVFIAHGVRIISVEENYDSNKSGKTDMQFEMYSMFADQYAKTVSASVAAALAAKVRRGEHFAKVPFGYERINKKLQINEEQAEVIRYIFKLYNEGMGYISVARRLNDEGILSPSGNKWGCTSVATIVRNRTYIGDYVSNKYTTVKIGGRKKQIVNPQEKWQVHEAHHPAIIIKSEYWKANSKEKGEKRVKTSRWNEFRGIAVCGECGSNIVIERGGYRKLKKTGETKYWEYLCCSKYRRYKEHGCVKHIPIQYDNFREFILTNLKHALSGNMLEVGDKKQIDKKRETKKLKAELSGIDGKNKKLLELYLEQMIDKDTFQAKKKELENRSAEIEIALFKLSSIDEEQNRMKVLTDAIMELDKKDADLYNSFKTLINKIEVSHEGTINIEYTFKA